jgi:hypothetical protein
MNPSEFIARFKVPCFYHFTDTRNLPSIQAKGGLFPWADIHAQVTAPGGNDWSHEADERNGLDKYVHLALMAEHPMEYFAREDGRIIEARFLQIDPGILLRPGVLFCPDVSNKSGVSPLTFADAIGQMDFEVVFDRTDWRDPEIKRRRAIAKKYELLVPGHIPLTLIRGI